MKEELYINGEAVDLDESVNITLNYKSNMLTDLSKIVGNNSYTIKLPKTQRNLGIVGCADMPGAVSSFPRVTHDARYFRNGVEIVSRGKAVLLAVNESIEVVLTWGISSAVYRLVDDSRNINEFPYIDDYIMWESSNTASPYDGVSEIMNTDINYGLIPNEKLAAIHPSVRSTYIFNLISSQYRVSFDFPEDRMEFIRSLIVPLLTRNGGYSNANRSLGIVSRSSLTNEYVIQKIGADFDSSFEHIPDSGREYLFVFRVLKDGKVSITPSFSSPRADKGIYYGTDDYEENIEYLPYRYDTSGERVVYIYDEPVSLDLKKGDLFAVNLMNSSPIGINGSFFQFNLGVEQVQIGDKFPIVENLPGITALDYIKAIASMTGLFCVPTSDGDTIKFVKFDNLAERGKAVDWSDKLLQKDNTGRPNDLKYTLDDFAQRNRMLWSDDNSVNIATANGVIYVDDMTIEKEREAVKLPFAASDVRVGKAVIRLYEYSNDGKPELQSVEPRILIERNVRGNSTGDFNGLQWGVLLGNYYGIYQQSVKTPVVITENVLLDEFTLRDMDLSIPVYLRQYGRYYAVVEVKAPSNGVCECKLLQLD